MATDTSSSPRLRGTVLYCRCSLAGRSGIPEGPRIPAPTPPPNPESPGSSPRLRGTDRCIPERFYLYWFIPAPAGNRRDAEYRGEDFRVRGRILWSRNHPPRSSDQSTPNATASSSDLVDRRVLRGVLDNVLAAGVAWLAVDRPETLLGDCEVAVGIASGLSGHCDERPMAPLVDVAVL